MGRGCCETYGEEHGHEHEMDEHSEAAEVLMAPELPAEIEKTVISAGSGCYPRKGDEVRVHYTGWLKEDGSKFDSSVDRGQLFSFRLGGGQVIKGWDLGVATMQKGEKARFVLPAEYAYGARGSPPKIPGGATLEFEIELFSFGEEEKDVFGDGRATYRYVAKSRDWQTPREGDEVEFELHTPETDTAAAQVRTFSHTLQKRDNPVLNGELLDALLAELKKQDVVAVTLNEEEAKRNSGLRDFQFAVKRIMKVDDVSLSAGEKRVFKKTLVPGEGYKHPELGSRVTVAVEVSNADGFVLLSADAVNFELGACMHSELLEAAVAKMAVNETALVWTPASEAEIVKDAQLSYPAETGLQFRVTLTAIDAETKAFFSMDKEEKLRLAETLKEAGSRVLKEGRVHLAVDKYKQAVKIFEHKDNDSVLVKTLLKACRLNMAMCYLKLNLFKQTLEETGKIIAEDALNVKALYRHATAQHKLGDHLQAEQTLKKLFDVDSENAEAKLLLVAVKDAIKKDNDKQKGLFAKMFKAVGRD